MKLILGLDLGKKTGIAKAYDELAIALPYKIVFSFKELVLEINELQPSFLVIGWPILLDGREGEQCNRVKSWVTNLIHLTYKMPIYYEDERFSTEFFKGMMDEDSMSAAWILQKFLDKRKS